MGIAHAGLDASDPTANAITGTATVPKRNFRIDVPLRMPLQSKAIFVLEAEITINQSLTSCQRNDREGSVKNPDNFPRAVVGSVSVWRNIIHAPVPFLGRYQSISKPGLTGLD